MILVVMSKIPEDTTSRSSYGATDSSKPLIDYESTCNSVPPDETPSYDDILATQQLHRKESRMILKNVVVLSLSSMFQQTAFQSMERLQSSINPVEGLGAYSIAAIYAASIICNSLFSTLIIKKWTVKWSIVLTQLGYSFYVAAQFWPQFYTLIPTAIILGLSSAPLGVARRTYITQVGHAAAQIGDNNVEVAVTRLFSIFFVFLHSAAIWGNLIASLVLESGGSAFANMTDDDFAVCGASFCPDTADNSNNTNLEPPSTIEIYTLSSVYLGSALLAVFITAIFLEPLTRWNNVDADTEDGRSGLDFLIETFKQIKVPYQMLLIPLSIWGGIQQGFLFSEYTRAYISCAYGTQYIGYVLIVYGVCTSLFPILLNPVVRCCGRIPIFIFGALCNTAGILLMALWQPHPRDTILFYVISGIWGIANAIWQTQINALYGILFRGSEEAAFSVYGLCISLGWFLAFILNNMVCTFPHLCVISSFLTTGMVGYLIVEIIHKCRPQSDNGYQQLHNGNASDYPS